MQALGSAKVRSCKPYPSRIIRKICATNRSWPLWEFCQYFKLFSITNSVIFEHDRDDHALPTAQTIGDHGYSLVGLKKIEFSIILAIVPCIQRLTSFFSYLRPLLIVVLHMQEIVRSFGLMLGNRTHIPTAHPIF